MLNLPLFRTAFRPMFLSGALFSVLAVALWVFWLNGVVEWSPYGGTYWWHAHEMLFGFVVAIIVGFLLTAVQNWTGQISAKGNTLLILWGTWLAGRLVLLTDIVEQEILVALIDFAFLPLAAILLARPLVKVRQTRNLFFVPLLLIMAICNGYMHLSVLQGEIKYSALGSHSMVMFVTFLMCVMGGRVFPMFTANGTGTSRVENIRSLDIASLSTSLLIAAVFFANLNLPSILMAGLCGFASICHYVRCLRWRIWVTFGTPLVWSLHLSYLCIPTGYLLLAYHFLTGQIAFSIALHCLTIGAMGLMILAMISRVSLGHTGRKIVVGNLMGSAFLVLFLAFLIRLVGGIMWDNYLLSLTLSGAAWLLAYSIFVVVYFPKLSKARIDGRPG